MGDIPNVKKYALAFYILHVYVVQIPDHDNNININKNNNSFFSPDFDKTIKVGFRDQQRQGQQQ